MKRSCFLMPAIVAMLTLVVADWRPADAGHRRRMMDTWYHTMPCGQPLPTLPIWLKESWAISLDLESSYEETCRTLRIR